MATSIEKTELIRGFRDAAPRLRGGEELTQNPLINEAKASKNAVFRNTSLPFSPNRPYSLRSEKRVSSEQMSKSLNNLLKVEKILEDLFARIGKFQSRFAPMIAEPAVDAEFTSDDLNCRFHLQVTIRERITPQIADELFARIKAVAFNGGPIQVVYAPVISPRVAEIAVKYGISYLDNAGNCLIVDGPSHLFIRQSGLKGDAALTKQKAVDLFAPKSSRILRAMLSDPARGWQLAELASMPDVDVSVGLAFKVKQALVKESYAQNRDRLLFLTQPKELLDAWLRKPPAPVLQRQFYMRGDVESIEAGIAKWCEKSNVQYALARFSAAWRYAREVRYSVASFYVNEEAFGTGQLASLITECGAKEVDSGANLVLLSPFDKSVFAGRRETPEQTTSPLQTYLDLQSLAGRGAEAASAVYDKLLRHSLESTELSNERST